MVSRASLRPYLSEWSFVPSVALVIVTKSVGFTMPVYVTRTPTDVGSATSFRFVVPPDPVAKVFATLTAYRAVLDTVNFATTPSVPPIAIREVKHLHSTSVTVPDGMLVGSALSTPLTSTTHTVSTVSMALKSDLAVDIFLWTRHATYAASSAPLIIAPGTVPPYFALKRRVFGSVTKVLSDSLVVSTIFA